MTLIKNHVIFYSKSTDVANTFYLLCILHIERKINYILFYYLFLISSLLKLLQPHPYTQLLTQAKLLLPYFSKSFLLYLESGDSACVGCLGVGDGAVSAKTILSRGFFNYTHSTVLQTLSVPPSCPSLTLFKSSLPFYTPSHPLLYCPPVHIPSWSLPHPPFIFCVMFNFSFFL
jgi:hypothetical protein